MPETMMSPGEEAEQVDEELYDLEFRAKEDDAWYSVWVLLDSETETLTVKYLCFPAVSDAVFSASTFKTKSEVHDLVGRFRPVSRQLQDNECPHLSVGIPICASVSADGALKFYDAIIDDVHRQDHSISTKGDKYEECLCMFVLFWKHGPFCHKLTNANIASMCGIQPVKQVDPRIYAFTKLAEDKITDSNSNSIAENHALPSEEPSSCKRRTCLSLEKGSESSRDISQEMAAGEYLRSLMWKSEAYKGNVIYSQHRDQDGDIGPPPSSKDCLISAEARFILINNLEMDLSLSSIKQFIYEKTSILAQAILFPSLLSEPFARGVIMTDCQQKFRVIYEFLDSPNHIIVSSRGRPWVITEKPLKGKLGETLSNIIASSQDDIQDKKNAKELDIVHSGTDAYNKAKLLKGLFKEFINHESQVCKKFLFEEKRILQSAQLA